MEEAIKLAIEEGGMDKAIYNNKEYLVLQPGFWQALGKALGWYGGVLTGFNSSGVGKRQEKWLFVALDFFELKLTGGDEEAFWKELLKSTDLGGKV